MPAPRQVGKSALAQQVTSGSGVPVRYVSADEPALLRRLFELACRYSGQILSYTKMLGRIKDAGNTTTLAHYLDLMAGAGMVCSLQKVYVAQATNDYATIPISKKVPQRTAGD